MTKRNRRVLLIGVSSLVPLTALAQGASSPNAAAGLEEVVVTAERRETNLQNTSMSLVALSEETLDSRGIRNIQDLSQFTPGLSVGGDTEGGGIRPLFVIRGVGQASGRDSVDRGVGLYVDDIYVPRTPGSILQLLDVERVEVLRGPAGTLFGRNTTGGAIRYVTRKPTHDFEATADVTVGSYDRLDIRSLMNVPLGDKVAARFQFGSFQRDGYIDQVNATAKLGDNDDIVARGVVRIEPTAGLTVDLGVNYAKSADHGVPYRVTALRPGDFGGLALSAALVRAGQPALTGPTDARFVFSDRYKLNGSCFLGTNSLLPAGPVGEFDPNAAGRFNDRNGYCDYGNEVKNTSEFIDVNWKFADAWSLRSLTGYDSGRLQSSSDWSTLGIFRVFDDSKTSSFSQEMQLKFAGSQLDAVGGLYYFHEDPRVVSKNRLLAYAGPSPTSGQCCSGGFNRLRDLSTNSLGAFGQATYAVTDQFDVIIGGRYSQDRKSIRAVRTNRPTAAPGTVFSASDDWSSTDFRATLQYQWTPQLMTYATASSGFKSGGFNDDPATVSSATTLNGGITSYDPEHVTNYEVGLRSQFLSNTLRVNLTGFYMNYRDMQLGSTVIDPSTNPPSTNLLVSNAGQLHLSGLEADLLFKVTDGLTVNASVSTLHQSFVRLSDSSALIISSTCTNPSQPTFSTCDAQDIARAPSLQYTLGAIYGRSVGVGDITLSAQYGYTGKQESANNATTSVVLDSYGVLNLRAEFAPTDAHWSVALIGTNVTDKYYATTATDFVGFFGDIVESPGRPAEYGVELKARF